MNVMDVIAETQTATIEWAPVARTMMEQLSDAEQAEVRSAVDRIARGFDPAQVEHVARRRQGQRPFFVLRASPALRGGFHNSRARRPATRSMHAVWSRA